jgi:hypothetical protein
MKKNLTQAVRVIALGAGYFPPPFDLLPFFIVPGCTGFNNLKLSNHF